MENRTKTRLARQRLILMLVLCAALPPLGMVLVWRSRYPRRGKLVLSVLSTLILTLMISGGLRLRKPEDIVPPSLSATYINTEPTAAPDLGLSTPAPAFGEAPVSGGTDPGVIDTGTTDDGVVVAPANPNG